MGVVDLCRWLVREVFTVYMCIIYTRAHVDIYSKPSLNRPTLGLTLNGPFKEMVGLGS